MAGLKFWFYKMYPKPEIKPDQILVKVQAVAVNPIDCKIRKIGAFGYGAGSILGFDVSGTVEQTGALVRNVQAGDAVFYCPDFSGPGANAQYHAVRADIVAKKPAHWWQGPNTGVNLRIA